jgi:hypothetical protein
MVASNPQTKCKVVQALPAAAHVADVTPSAGIDCKGFTELLVVVNAGTYVGAASVTITLQESSVSDGTGDSFAAWTGSAFAAITTANDAARHLGRINLRGRERYIRPVFDYTGNGTTEVAPTGIEFVLMHPEDSAIADDTYAVNA